MADRIIGFAVKGVASGIGLATEANSARKEKKRLKKAGEGADRATTPQSDAQAEELTTLKERDEEQWELDDAQEELIHHTSSDNEPAADADGVTDTFVHRYPPPAYSESAGTPRLPFPVILPQRRPKDRSRGFIRAYAPILENSGIDQAMFLDFLNTFNKASLASDWINAINLAGFAFMALPTAIGFAASVALTIATKTAMEVQGRARTNSFLNKINNEFFKPRGLYCLVMTWNPESTEMHEHVNINAKISSSLLPTSSNLGKIQSKFRSSDGNTYGNEQLLEAAPLVFPELDALAEQTGEEAVRKRDKVKNAGAFVDDYWDRRAQAKYAAKNPDNVLTYEPTQKFASRYADPNHPASSGSLVSLLTGGLVNPPSLGRRNRGGGAFGRRGFGGGFGGNQGGRGLAGDLGRRGFGRDFGGRQGQIEMQQGMERGFAGQQQHRGLGGGTGGIGPGLPIEGVKRLLKGKVLYLMIVNMPTEQEMMEAQAAIAAARQ